jgi:molecular chaperone IbpA
VQISIAKFRCARTRAEVILTAGGHFCRTTLPAEFSPVCPSCKAKPYPHINIARAASGRASGGGPWAPRGGRWQIVSRRFVNVVGTTTFLASFKEDSEMRQFDLSPLYRSTIGFDRLFNMIDQAAGLETMPSYPPYNIERTGENAYRISVAVAGFGATDLAIETKENTLTIRGSREREGESEKAKQEVLYQGIAARSFERRFQLADHVHVTSASLENGLLHIDLTREVPEAQKPRRIPIGTEGAKPTIATPRAA